MELSEDPLFPDHFGDRSCRAAVWETGCLLKVSDRSFMSCLVVPSGRDLGKSMSPRVPATKSPQGTFQSLMGPEAVDWNGRGWGLEGA